MNRVLALVAAAAPLLAGCGAVYSYPLPASPGDARDMFAPIGQCAAAQNLPSAKHPDSINVNAVPGAWVQYMVQPNGFNMVVVVHDTSGGGPAIGERAAAAKQKGDEIYACAARAPRVAGAAPPPPPPALAPPPPDAPPGAPPPPPGNAPNGKNPMAGFGAGFGKAFDAMGKGMNAMNACTQLTMCRTRLSGEVCLGADKPCLDEINGGDSGGPDACGRNLERVRAAAHKHAKKRIPGWKLPDECK